MPRSLSRTLTRRLAGGLIAVTLASTVATAAMAQSRSPVYESARRSGQVGEKVDGYLGYPVTPPASLRGVVEDINIRRKALYATRAQAQNATVEDYAFTAGCLAILRTVPGERYQAPDGSWQTRTASEPQRDPRCP